MKKRWLEVLAIAKGTQTGLETARVDSAERLRKIEAIAAVALKDIENSPAAVRERNAREAEADGDDEVAMLIRMGR